MNKAIFNLVILSYVSTIFATTACKEKLNEVERQTLSNSEKKNIIVEGKKEETKIANQLIKKQPIFPNNKANYQKTRKTKSLVLAKGTKDNTIDFAASSNKGEIVKQGDSLTKQEILPEEFNFSYIAAQNLVPKQVFEITANRDTIIWGALGARFVIKANSFVTEFGELAQGKVNIFLQEFYHVEDMLLADLNTTSNKQLLETGGMFCIRASEMAGQKPLELLKGKEIGVTIPTFQSPKSDMQVYYSKDSLKGTDWDMPKQNFPVTILLPDSLFYKHQITYEIKKNKGKNIFLGKEQFRNNFTIPIREKSILDTLIFDVSVDRRGHIKLTSDKVSGTLKHIHISYDREKKWLSNEIKYDIEVFKKGKIDKNESYGIANFDISSKKLKEFAKGYVTKKQLMKMRCTLLLHRLQFRNGATMSNTATIADKFSKQEATADEIGAYSFSVLQMGWVNIDKLYKNNKSPIDFVVNVPQDVDVKIVFNDVVSVKNWDYSTKITKKFFGMPADAKIKVVAIKLLNNKPAVAFVNSSITRKNLEILDFKPIENLEELRKELAVFMKKK